MSLAVAPRLSLSIGEVNRRFLLDLIKALVKVKQHQRKTHTGQIVQVAAHYRNYLTAHEKKGMIADLAAKMAGGNKVAHKTLTSAKAMAKATAKSTGKEVHVHYDEGAGKYVTSHEPPAGGPAPGKHHLTAHANGKVMMKHELHGHIEANPLLMGKQLHQVGAKAVDHYAKITAVSRDLKGAEAEKYRQLLHESHKIAVQQALDKGEKVSAAALKAHPEFQAKADEVLKAKTEAKAKKAAEKLEKMSEAAKAKQQEKKKTKHAAAAIAAQAHEEAATKYGHDSDEAASAGTELKKYKVLLHPQEDGTTHYKIGDETIHTASVRTHPDKPASGKKPGAQPGNQNAYKGGPKDEPAHGKVLPGDTDPSHATPASIAYAHSLGDGPAAQLYQESLKTADYHEGRVKKIGAKLWQIFSVTGKQSRYPVPTKKQAIATAKMNAIEELATLKKNAEEEAALSALESGKSASKAGEVVTAENAEPGDVVKSKHYDGDCIILGPSSHKVENVDTPFLKVLTPNGHVDNLLPSGLVHTGEIAPERVAHFEDAKKGPVASGKTGAVTAKNVALGDWIVSGSGKPSKVVSFTKSGHPIEYMHGQTYAIDLHGKTFWQTPEDAKKEAQAALIGQTIKHVKQLEPGQYIHNPGLSQVYEVQESDAGMTTLKAPDGSISKVHTASLVGSKFADKDDFTKSDRKPGGQPGNQNAYKGGPQSTEGAAALKQAHADMQTLSKKTKDAFAAWTNSQSDSKDEKDIANRHYESAKEKFRHAAALYAGHALSPAQMHGLNDFMKHAPGHGYRNVTLYVKNNPEGLADGSVSGGAILSYDTATGDKRYTKLNMDGQTNLGTFANELIVDKSTNDGLFYSTTAGMLQSDAHKVLQAHLKPMALANGAPVYTVGNHKVGDAGNIGGPSTNPDYLHINGGYQATSPDMDDNVYHKATLSGLPYTHSYSQGKGQTWGRYSVNANHGGHQAYMDPVLAEAGATTEQALMWDHLTKGAKGHVPAIKPIAAGVTPEGNLVIKHWPQPYKKGAKPMLTVITPDGKKDASAKPNLAEIKMFHGQIAKPEEVASAAGAPAGAIEKGPGAYVADPSIKAVYQGEKGQVKHGTGPDGNGVELRFSSKPDAETLAQVKKFYKWSGMSQCWWAKNPGPNAMALAHDVMGTGKKDAGKAGEVPKLPHPTGEHMKKLLNDLNDAESKWKKAWAAYGTIAEEKAPGLKEAWMAAQKAYDTHAAEHVRAHLNDAQMATVSQHPKAQVLVHTFDANKLPILETQASDGSSKVTGAYINEDGSLSQSWEANPAGGKYHPGSYGPQDYVSASPLEVQAASGKKPGGQPGNQNAYKGGPRDNHKAGKAVAAENLDIGDVLGSKYSSATHTVVAKASNGHIVTYHPGNNSYVYSDYNHPNAAPGVHVGINNLDHAKALEGYKNPVSSGKVGPVQKDVQVGDFVTDKKGNHYKVIQTQSPGIYSPVHFTLINSKTSEIKHGNTGFIQNADDPSPGSSDYVHYLPPGATNKANQWANKDNVQIGDVVKEHPSGNLHTVVAKSTGGKHVLLAHGTGKFHESSLEDHLHTGVPNLEHVAQVEGYKNPGGNGKSGPATYSNIEPGDFIKNAYGTYKVLNSAGQLINTKTGKLEKLNEGENSQYVEGPAKAPSGKKPGGQPGNQNAYKGGPQDEPGAPGAPAIAAEPEKPFEGLPGEALSNGKSGLASADNIKPGDVLSFEGEKAVLLGYDGFSHTYQFKAADGTHSVSDEILVSSSDEYHKDGPITHTGTKIDFKAGEPANLDNIEPGDKIEFPTHDGSGEGNPVKPYTVVKYKDSAGEVYLKGEDGKEIAVTAGLFDPKSVAYHMHGPILHSSKKPGGQPGNQNAYKGGSKDEPGAVPGVPQEVIDSLKARFGSADQEKVQSLVLQVKATSDGYYVVAIKDSKSDKVHFAAYKPNHAKLHFGYTHQIKTILNNAHDVTEQVIGKPSSLQLPTHEQPHPGKPAKPNGKEGKPGTAKNIKVGDIVQSNYDPFSYYEVTAVSPGGAIYGTALYDESKKGYISGPAGLSHTGYTTDPSAPDIKAPKSSGSKAKPGTKVTAVNAKPGDTVTHSNYGPAKLVAFNGKNGPGGKNTWTIELPNGSVKMVLQQGLVHGSPADIAAAPATAKQSAKQKAIAAAQPTGPAAPSTSSGLKSGDQIPESHQHLLKSDPGERNKQYAWQGSSGIDASSSVAHKVCSKLHSDLNSKQKNALSSYRGAGYHSINSTLRNGVKPSEHTSKQIAALDQAMGEASGIPHDMTFKRGKGAYVRKMLQDNVGKIFVEDGFTSVSNSEQRAKGFAGSGGVLINVRVPKGTPGLYMDQVFGNNWEYELMLPRGCAFIVHSVTPSSGTHYSHVADIELIHPGQIGENPEQYKKWGIAPPEPPKPWTGKQFDSANQVKSWAIQNTAGAIGNSVSAEQQQAFDEFVGGAVHDVNGYYQGGKKGEKVKNDPALKDQVMKLASTISSAIASAPGTDQDITLKKMMASNHMSSQYSNNETILDPGFPVLSNTPTSALSAQSAGQQAIEVTYHIPKGSKLAYLGDHPKTKEPLFALPKDSVFAVKESKKEGGLHKVTLELK